MSPARGRSADTPAKRLLRRALWIAGALGMVAFAAEGGEFGTSDVYLQRVRRERLRAEVEALRTEVEALKVEVKAVSTDNARLERIARERFGMVKGDKETIYWTTRGNDASGNSTARTTRASDVVRDTSMLLPRG